WRAGPRHVAAGHVSRDTAGTGDPVRLRPRCDAPCRGAAGRGAQPAGLGQPRSVDGLRHRHLPGLRRTDPARRGVETQIPLRLHRRSGVRRDHRRLARISAIGGAAQRRGAGVSLAVRLGPLQLKNPLLAASGTFGYGVELEGLLDLSLLGGLVSKGLYLEPRDGCPTPRIAETPSGLLNAIGLQGVGVQTFVADVLPRLARYDTAVLVNVCADTGE